MVAKFHTPWRSGRPSARRAGAAALAGGSGAWARTGARTAQWPRSQVPAPRTTRATSERVAHLQSPFRVHSRRADYVPSLRRPQPLLFATRLHEPPASGGRGGAYNCAAFGVRGLRTGAWNDIGFSRRPGRARPRSRVPAADRCGRAARGDTEAGRRGKATASPKTPWGDPDLQGIWSNTTTTPLERLPEAKDKTHLTDDERDALSRQVADRLDQDKPPAQAGAVVPYNEFWYERGTLTNRTSLIIDPPDGRLPPFTPDGQKRWAEVQAARKSGAADTWLDRSPYDRCITRGIPGAMMPGFYNHNYQILQTKEYVAIVVEMVHDARIIPLDRRPHLPSNIRQWLGDSRGHFEGNTLVVETTNLNDKVFDEAPRPASAGTCDGRAVYPGRCRSDRLPVHHRGCRHLHQAVDRVDADDED